MTSEQLLTAFGGIDIDMLNEAEAFESRKRAVAMWRVLAAALSCVVIAVGIVMISRPTPKTYALEYVMHQSSDGTTVPLDEGNVWIYYARDGKIKKEYIKLPLDVENVLMTWKHLSGIGDEVKLICYSQTNDHNVISDGYTREYVSNDGNKTTIVISMEIVKYINESDAVLNSFDKTMGAYLGAEAASKETDAQTKSENVTDKVTENDKATETDKATDTDEVTDSETETNAPSITTESEVELPSPPPIDESLFGTIGDGGLITAEHEVLSENRKAELYQTADNAELNKNYQYAYGLYSYLSMQGYKDSGTRAWDLTARAFAMPVVRVHKGVFENFKDYTISTDYGFMYTDENGTPHFLYCVNENGVWITRTYTPDRYLKGVTSFYASEYCRVVNCIALNRDGSMQVFYDEDRYKNLSSREDYSVADISVAASFFQSTKGALLGEFNVNRIIPKRPNNISVCVMHTNNKLDYWGAVKWSNSSIKYDIGDEMLSDLVSVAWGSNNPYGCTSDGRIVGSDADIADIKNVRYAYMIDPSFILSDGHAYYRNGTVGRYYYKKDAVFAASNDCFISSEGRIYNSNDVTKYNAQSVSCVYDLSSNNDFLYVISNNGKLLSVELTDGSGRSKLSDTEIMMIEELKQIQLFVQ